MIKVAITGGIGAGKSLATEILKLLGTPVYHADIEAKRLMTFNPSLKQKIHKLFGPKTYLPDGNLNRPWLAQQIFQENSLLNQMNAIVHPVVYEDLEHWFVLKSDFPYAVYESALVSTEHKNKLVDLVITVYCPEKIRVQRVMNRDGITKEKVLDRVSKQRKYEVMQIQAADFLIINHDISLIKQVYAIHDYLISKKLPPSET